MSFSTISIYRDFPVIAGYVQVPPCHEAAKTEYTIAEFEAAVTGETQTRLNHPLTNPNTGSSFGSQEWMRVASPSRLTNGAPSTVIDLSGL